MRILKIASLMLLVSMTTYYFSSCSSAEQTTAKLAYQRGEYQKAEQEFLKELNQNPANEEAWFYLAMTRVMLKNPTGTKEAIDKYRGMKQNTFKDELLNAWYTLLQSGEKSYNDGEANRQKKNDDAAVNSYNDALRDFEMAYIILPDSVIVKDNIEVVNSQINVVLLKPLIDKGVEFESKGDFESAIGEYKKAMDKVKPGSANYEIVIYDICLANLKWGEKMREANSEDPAYKDKYKDALPYLKELTNSKEVCTTYNSYMLLVQVYANLSMSQEALDAIAQRDKILSEHPECGKK